MLSLSSGERIRFPASLDPLEALASGQQRVPTPVSFLFETDSLEHASPATVSRLAVILVADPSKQEVLRRAGDQVSKVARGLEKLDGFNDAVAHLQIVYNSVAENKVNNA